jgi:hypothetical protein
LVPLVRLRTYFIGTTCATSYVRTACRYWFSLQLPFGVVVLASLGVWTLMHLVLGLLILIPFEIDNSTEHIKMEAYSGPDHSRNDTLAAAFFFAVQTLSTTGYGSLAPTSWCVRTRVRTCVCACVCAYVCACVRACARACVLVL